MKLSTIRKLMPSEGGVGRCDCCGEKVPLLYRDYCSLAHFGNCCIRAVLNAERVLAAYGMRPPTAEEICHFRE